MAKRTVVEVDVKYILELAAKNEWNASSLARKIGKYRTWLSEVSRGKNLPSPEEAAKMCEILYVEPEDILVRPEDIALVRSLMDEKKPTVKDDGRSGMSEARRQLYEAVDDLTDEQCIKLLGIILEAKKIL